MDIVVDEPVLIKPPEPPAPAQPPLIPPPSEVPPPDGFPLHGIYGGVYGGATLVLNDWDLGAGVYIDHAGRHRITPTTGPLAGLRVGYQLFTRLAVEAEGSWLLLPNRFETGQGLAYGGNVLFHVLSGKWTPILEAGGGVYQALSGATGRDIDLRLHAGVGLRGMLNRWLSIRAGARGVLTDGFVGFDPLSGANIEIYAGVEGFFYRPTK